MRASVCMATYNGVRFMDEQLNSILFQLRPGDELVICDDCSTDGTRERLARIDDPRVRVIYNERNLGHIRNFEKCLQTCRGDIIFLSDQDDVWAPEKIEHYRSLFRDNPRVSMVASDFSMIDSQGKSIGESVALGLYPWRSRAGRVLGIFAGRLPYFGCTMAMRREILGLSLPIPEGVEAHDVWIALVCNTTGQVRHVGRPLVARRIHGANLTPIKRRTLSVILRSRSRLLRAYVRFCIARAIGR